MNWRRSCRFDIDMQKGGLGLDDRISFCRTKIGNFVNEKCLLFNKILLGSNAPECKHYLFFKAVSQKVVVERGETVAFSRG